MSDYKSIGKIIQVIGPVVDVAFNDEKDLPNIYDALEIKRSNGESLILETQQAIGENAVRTIAMDSTDGLFRGMEVYNRGDVISMPIGSEIRGRLFNVIGKNIDGLPQVDTKASSPIHKDPPKFDELSTKTEVLYTGIKVIDLIEPYAKGGKVGLFGGAGVGKTVIIQELMNNIANNIVDFLSLLV